MDNIKLHWLVYLVLYFMCHLTMVRHGRHPVTHRVHGGAPVCPPRDNINMWHSLVEPVESGTLRIMAPHLPKWFLRQVWHGWEFAAPQMDNMYRRDPWQVPFGILAIMACPIPHRVQQGTSSDWHVLHRVNIKRAWHTLQDKSGTLPIMEQAGPYRPVLHLCPTGRSVVVQRVNIKWHVLRMQEDTFTIRPIMVSPGRNQAH